MSLFPWMEDEDEPVPVPPPAPAKLAGVLPPAVRPSKFFLWIYGISGMGKTLYMRQSYRRRIDAGGRGVFVDPNAMNGDLGRVVRSAGELQAAHGAGVRSCVYQPEWGEQAADLWPVLFRLGGLLVAVDEAQSYAAPQSLDKGFLELVQKGRNRSVDMITTSQAPTTLHPYVRQNFDAVVSFRQGDPQYADRMARDYFRTPAAGAWLLALPKFNYLRVTMDGKISRGIVRVPGG